MIKEDIKERLVNFIDNYSKLLANTIAGSPQLSGEDFMSLKYLIQQFMLSVIITDFRINTLPGTFEEQFDIFIRDTIEVAEIISSCAPDINHTMQ